MQRSGFGFISISLAFLMLLTAAFSNAVPLMAVALVEGRTYDQAHDSGYIDWSGSVQYVYLTHRDGSSLPPQEGGTLCSPSCSEWVTRLNNGGAASGSFDRNVSYFEAMVAFTSNTSVGSATLRACSAVSTWNLYTSAGKLPGFVSMALSVPAGCRSWSLSASGGFVDFRSIDVNYSSPPPTPTFTSTPLPTATQTATLTPTATSSPTATMTPSRTPTNTFTPTSTYTVTPTNTPTATPSNTPSATATPLPPEIAGQVVCDLWGEAGWCKGDESLDLITSDPQGWDVTVSGDLNETPFSCGSSCSLPLPQGMGTANYSVISTSGRTASGSSTWQRDGTPPVLEIALPPIDGRNGWYVSEVDLSVIASDVISGLDSIAGSMDEGGIWISFPIHLSDGVFPVVVRARDVAGNEALVTEAIHVDTVPPVARFTSHSDGEFVQGSVLLAGKVEDATSGAATGELSSDGGTTWQAVSMDGNDSWSFLWRTGEVPNGQYPLKMRAMDQAGNLGEAASITLVVNNDPPSVSITERWWIWEYGKLRVSRNHFPIASVWVKISDPENRWPEVVLEINPDKIPSSISWNRHFADGTMAPAGEYTVEAVACDVNDLCGRDTGIIAIPFVAASTATMTPSPTATLTITPRATFIPAQKPATLTPDRITPLTNIYPAPTQRTRSIPFWQLLGLLGLFLGIASASVVDPRPAALHRLRESLHEILSHRDADPINIEE